MDCARPRFVEGSRSKSQRELPKIIPYLRFAEQSEANRSELRRGANCMPKEYDINADFDLSLRPGWRGPVSGFQARQIDEMALHAALIGGPEDAVRLPAELPEEFVRSLDRGGLTLPQVTVRPAIRRERRFTPFGWNRAAAELNSRYCSPTHRPPLEVVRTVNGRTFAATLERDLFDDEFHVGEFRSTEEVASFLSRTPGGRRGWVVKSNHGNAALGNRRLHGPRLTEVDRRWLSATLEEDDRVLLEPWLHRISDLCVTLELTRDGKITDEWIHEIVNTAAGSFIGALFEPASRNIEPWRARLEEGTEMVAGRLANEGYFGPVCFDAFIWDDEGRPRLRPLADLNARLNVSRHAQRLWRVWGGGSVVYWRLFSRRKLRLPARHADLEMELGADCYDRDRQQGALICSPLWVTVGGHRRQLRRLGVLFVGPSRLSIMELERRFRERFER